MTKEEMDSFVKENMNGLNEGINNNLNCFPFNLAEELSDQNRQCDVRKLYDTINELHLNYKAALILRYKYKYTYRDIEEVLGYSFGYGRIVMDRILDSLKSYYDIYVV